MTDDATQKTDGHQPVRVETEMVTDCSDPAEWCSLHHLADDQARDAVVDIAPGASASFCGSCMGRLNGAIRIRMINRDPRRVFINAKDLDLTKPKEKQHGTET